MIDIVSALQVLLQGAGYGTRLTSVDNIPVVCFEDDAVMGFSCVFDDPMSLLARWRSMETSLLTRFAYSLGEAGDKAWNVYCAFLATDVATEIQAREVGKIEENLERTRKIAACGLLSRDELLRALLPVLPLQYQPVLEAPEVKDRLTRRIEMIAPASASVVLDDSVSPIEVVRLLGDRK